MKVSIGRGFVKILMCKISTFWNAMSQSDPSNYDVTFHVLWRFKRQYQFSIFLVLDINPKTI